MLGLAERGRAKTGIAGLDKIIAGGFTRNSINVISGGTGAGRSTLGMQFLINGAQKFKEPGLFISFDENKRTMTANMKSYGWDLAAMERDKKFVFIEYPPQEIEHFLSQEGVIRDLIDAMGIERIVIDSITPFALQFPNEDERRKGLIKLTDKLRKWGCTVVIIAEEAEGSHQNTGAVPKTKAGIEMLADSQIHLYNVQVKGERKRGMEVVKMRGTPHGNKIVPFEIGKNGVTVYPEKKFID